MVVADPSMKKLFMFSPPFTRKSVALNCEKVSSTWDKCDTNVPLFHCA